MVRLKSRERKEVLSKMIKSAKASNKQVPKMEIELKAIELKLCRGNRSIFDYRK